MRYRQMGRSGLTVSVVGLGCNNFGTRLADDVAATVANAAIDAGITLFDTADFYGAGGSEELLGKALGGRRDEVVLATKFGLAMPGKPPDEARGSRRYIRMAVHASLRVEDDVIPVCERYGIGLLPFFPLANGLLTGKYHRGVPLPAGSRLANEPARASSVMTDAALARVEALVASPR